MSTVPTASGHCLCAAVRFSVRGTLRPITYCHCEQCRRSGGHFVAATACRPQQLAIDGEENIQWYRSSASAQRGFCRHCGSNLFWQPAHGEYWCIWAGSLDCPTGLHAAQHIYMESAADYYTINDGLPQFPREGNSTYPEGIA